MANGFAQDTLPLPERFGESYFYGKRESNYSNYETMNPHRQFKSVRSFIKEQGIRGKCLDVGCAFGSLLKRVSPHFDELYGCDISMFAIGKATGKVPEAEFRVADVEEGLPYPDGEFDCITAMDILEHTRSFEKSFGNLVRKLREGGFLIFSVPMDNPIRKMFGFLDKDKTHISILPKPEIMRIIRKHGMRVMGRRYACSFPFIHKIGFIPAEIQFVLQKS
jgi:SAM-dependent methyltransferase